MKEWFKYEFGYVNIDSENFYLTNSGNWSDTKELKEKIKQIAHKDDNKSSMIIGFMIVVICILCFLLYKSFINGRLGLTLIFITVGGSFKLYQYLKTEIGSKFKIPLKKIKEIKFSNKNVEIVLCISVFSHTSVILAITSLSKIFSPKYLRFSL
uniref:hypothetical protein n=2 Tax=Flavobacterium sp. TaxID=239 RepID=UPI00404A3F53